MTKLYIIILNPDPDTNYGVNLFPPLKEGDVTLFYHPVFPGRDDSIMKCHIHGDREFESYTSKRKASTILSTAQDITAALIPEIEVAALQRNLWNLAPGINPALAVFSLVEECLENALDDGTPHPNLKGLAEIFRSGGDIRGVTMTDAGTLPLPDMMSIPTPEEPEDGEDKGDKAGEDEGEAGDRAVSWVKNDQESVLKLIASVMPAIKYEGFVPKFTRFTFLGKSSVILDSVRDLILCFLAYSHIGNNLSKLQIRRVDMIKAKRLMDAIEALRIMKAERTKKGLTLPRLAMAFMPEYLVFRKFLAGDLQSQTESMIGVEYKDIVFYGCKAIRSKEGYESFHKEFSSYIFIKGKDTDIDDPKFLKSYKQYNKVAIQGYNSDVGIHARMETAISSDAWTKKKAHEFIVEGLTAYLADGP